MEYGLDGARSYLIFQEEKWRDSHDTLTNTYDINALAMLWYANIMRDENHGVEKEIITEFDQFLINHAPSLSTIVTGRLRTFSNKAYFD